jgi:PhnB protein
MAGFGALSPETVGGSPVRFHLSVENVDEMVQRAVNAGAILLRPVADEFYGERRGMVTDPFGFIWHISTTKEAVSPEEMQRRWNEGLK